MRFITCVYEFYQVITVVAPTGEVFATLKPPTKPSLTVWEVQKGTVEGSIRLKNLETGNAECDRVSLTT